MKINITCKECNRKGRITLVEKDCLPEDYILRQRGWYWSNKDDCFYCIECESKSVSKMLKKIKNICKKKNIPIIGV